MSVRKRTWKGSNGALKQAWLSDYVDVHGRRHIKTFLTKEDADDHHANHAGRRDHKIKVQVGLRLSQSLHRYLVNAADDHGISLNSEIVRRLTRSQHRAQVLDELTQALTSHLNKSAGN